MNRRGFLQLAASTPLLLASGPAPSTAAVADELRSPDPLGLMLPPGFRAREIARASVAVAGTDYVWPAYPDGGATFATPDSGWIYVANSEVADRGGGVSAVRFGADGSIVDAYAIGSGTSRNCAGGVTPWRTWLTCEEVEDGEVYECDPEGERPAEVRPALGRFSHEAVACDPAGRALYLTEDAEFGRLYRFTPVVWGDLGDGRLEVARTDELGVVSWLPVESPDATAYAGGEGIAYHDGQVVFTTKPDQRVRSYDTHTETMTVLYEPSSLPEISGPDNVAFSSTGDLYVCEDASTDQELVLITGAGRRVPVLRLAGHEGSELAGPAFDPSGTRLYISSQRGAGGGGVTYEISGPFARLAAPLTTTTTSARVSPTTGNAAGRPDDTGGAHADDDSILPVVGAAGGVALLALGGLAWLRTRRGTEAS